MDATSHDPYVDFNFIINIDGVMTGGFSEVEGLPMDSDVECRLRGESPKAPKLQGLRRHTNLVLKRGFTNSKDLWEWYKSVKEGKTRRLSGTITVFDEARQVASAWRFDEALPQKWEGPAFNAKANAVAIEELEISVDGLELIPAGDDPKP